MEIVSLYRKYRPHNFENLVGQDHIKTTLSNAVRNSQISHAYLFTGPRGTGKTSTARIIAKALNCTNLKNGFDPCDECEFCKDINEGSLIDLIEIDAASNRGIDEIRQLKETLGFAPSRSKCKIHIIDEVHMMTKEAFNALLKTLEEPPENVYFILATTEIHKIPETIISRCQRFDFKRITEKSLFERLGYIAGEEGIKAEEKALLAISKYVDGGLRDAIGLLEQLSVNKTLAFDHVQDILGLTSFSLLEKLYEALVSGNTREGLQIVSDLHTQGSDLDQFAHELIDLLRNKMLDDIEKGDSASTAKLIWTIEIFQEAKHKLDASIPQLPLEIAVIKASGGVGAMNVAQVKSAPEAQAIPVDRPHQPITEPVKTPTQAETTPKAVTSELESTLGKPEIKNLKEHWPRVIERIKTPLLKNSLKQGHVLKIEGINVTLEFATNFHREKVLENRTELEQVIEDIFGTGAKIVAVVKELELSEKPKIDEAFEIFGGEIVG